MPQPKVLSVGKGKVASQNKVGPTMTMELFRTWTQKVEEINRHFDDWNNRLLYDWDNYLDLMDNIIEDMKK